MRGESSSQAKASELIAPCGMNCAVCRAHLRDKNPCPGCRAPDAGKPVTRVRCKIKTCAAFSDRRRKFCYQCARFPCANLNHLDERYRRNYRMSMVENLNGIRGAGMKKFLAAEKVRWTCSSCGGILCVHDGACATCGATRSC